MANWFTNHRQEFIRGHLKTFGQIRRKDIVDKFEIHPNQASGDIRDFIDANPGILIYDPRAKIYVVDKEAL